MNMAKTMTHQEALTHFEGPTLDNDAHYARLNPSERATHDHFVRAMNKAFAHAKQYGIPENYRAVLDYYRELDGFKRINQGLSLKQNDAGVVAYEDIYARDTAIARTVYRASVFDQLPLDTVTMATPKWQIKQYRLTGRQNPQITDSFTSPSLVKFDKSAALTQGIGLQIGVALGWQEMSEAAGGLWDHMAVLQSHAAEIFGLHKSRMGFRGTDFTGASFQDGSDAASWLRYGLLNNASNQTFEAGDLSNLDDNVTADGEVHDSIYTALADLDPARLRQDHQKYIISSRGIFGETLLESHRDANRQKTDLTRILESYFDTGAIQGWMHTDQVYKSTDTNATAPAVAAQDMWLIALGPELVKNHVIYPTQVLPMADKEFEQDFKEIMIYAHAIQFAHVDTTVNLFPCTIAADVTTTTTGVIYPEGMLDVERYARQRFS